MSDAAVRLTGPVPAIGFLHTAAVHDTTFRALLSQVAPEITDVAVVDVALLADARRAGVDDSLRERLRARLYELAERSVDVIVCTCSTLSGEAESLGPVAGVPVLRVDRPMAEVAVADGGRVALVTAVAATLAASRALLEQAAAAAGTDARVVEAPCLDAWELFERGDTHGYLGRLAEHVRGLAHDADVDVIVLAQASMAPVTHLVPEITLPVLSSPRLAVERAAALATYRCRPSR